MSKKVYKAIETFQYMGNRRRTIEKGAIIPEDFFVNEFGANAEKMKSVLLKLKKIKENDKDKEAKAEAEAKAKAKAKAKAEAEAEAKAKAEAKAEAEGGNENV